MTQTTSNIKTLGNTTDGVQVNPATDANGAAAKLGFFGTTPVVQPSGNAQAALTRGSACGSIITMQSSNSPTAVANITTAEKAITAANIVAGDLLYVNKPTSQAGLGVGNVRVSTTGSAGVTFSNFTAATITPTGSETYTVVAIRGVGALSATLSPAAVAANTIIEQQFSVTGLPAGQLVQVSKPTAQAGLDIVGCRVVSNNLLGITFANVTAATITPTASESYTVLPLSGLDAIGGHIHYDATWSPAAVANATSAEQALSITGLLAADEAISISKPTAQAGLVIGGVRVSAAGSLGVTFGNVTAATITPTGSESYDVHVFRYNPAAPLVLYSQTLTPVAVAANTTAEQTFTVTGLVSGSPVWVNKPSFTNGLGIAGVRVSAASTLAINYCNVTSAAITPPSETYIIGNFQMPGAGASNAVIQPVSDLVTSMGDLGNAIRSANVSLGLIAGA